MKDAIAKFQGKQNTTIPTVIYAMIKDEMNKYSIDEESLTKNHLFLFLSQYELGDHYENIHLIHHTLTGKPCPEISQYEERILQLNDIFEQVYAVIKDPEKKNSLNVNYKLLKFCQHLGANVTRDDFSFLKTYPKIKEHDDVTEKIFSILGWYFIETSL